MITSMTACSYALYVLVIYNCIYSNVRHCLFLKLALHFVRCLKFIYEVPNQIPESYHTEPNQCLLLAGVTAVNNTTNACLINDVLL